MRCAPHSSLKTFHLSCPLPTQFFFAPQVITRASTLPRFVSTAAEMLPTLNKLLQVRLQLR
jgi:hypothetical protein